MVKKYRTHGSKNNEVPGIEMALLPGYKVKKTTGPDFVYYTVSKNKNAQMLLYIGEHPNPLNNKLVGISISKEEVLIDGEKATWFVWEDRDKTYHREVLLRNYPDFPAKIHIIITGKELKQVNLLKKSAETFK